MSFRLRFSRRALVVLGVVTLVLIVLACTYLKRVRDRSLAVASIEKNGGTVIYDYNTQPLGEFSVRFVDGEVVPGPKWARKMLSDDNAFAKVLVVTLEEQYASEETMSHLGGLRHVKWLSIGTTDDGLKHVGKMRKLIMLDLSGSRITDAGLVHLYKLSELRQVFVSETQVSEQGRQDLRSAIPGLSVVH